MWVCLMLSVALIALRQVLRKFRGQRTTPGDYWALSAAVFIVGRLLANHFLLLYGSTRILSSEERTLLLQDAYSATASKIVTGSKLVLVTRSLLICVLWALKMAVLDLLGRLILKMPYERKLLYVFWIILATTFLASMATVFVGCSPFRRHWQIYPDPGSCVVGNIWLFTYEICNIITDVLLMVVPCSLILSVKLPMMQRLRVFMLFSIGLFLIAVSIMRILQGKGSRAQRAHTLWASLEILFAVIVAVAPTIYALAQNRNENDTYAKSHINMTNTVRTYTGGEEGNERYATRVWTELNDDASRTDNTSIEGILVETRYETSGTKM
ncbi:hypothetical protein T440DRAFT_491921 [Plenodomus tracheiphilus IPT5]|uniref:Rhodopsin domain-containing protein n=1 Tax=Plenodomus tracheiphilus IPT5 TaxID=1408161 RepID=A0A6A7AW25_9PLEO|nr:hypothetical protein T440DRAFT_491921 [Plenodomus tracheiphilus IPT5]